MRTLELKEAAAFLHIHPVTLLKKAQAGEVPAAKPGKCWVFLDVDLAAYLRANYRRQASSDSDETVENKPWLSIDRKTRRAGTSISQSKDDEYVKALGLKTEGKPKSTTTA
jgi:hypothetical protein